MGDDDHSHHARIKDHSVATGPDIPPMQFIIQAAFAELNCAKFHQFLIPGAHVKSSSFLTLGVILLASQGGAAIAQPALLGLAICKQIKDEGRAPQVL